MIINNDKVFFEKSDQNFIEKFGNAAAQNMVLDYKSTHRLPFIFDSYQLSYLLSTDRKSLFYISKNAKKHYKTITIKKNCNRERVINIPDSRLKYIQKNINLKILKFIPVSQYATAYIKNTNISANAKHHIGKKYLLKLDITDFFGSISEDMIYKNVFHSGNFPKHIGVMLTKLCCFDGYLPQGAPTSPALSNIVMHHFDKVLGEWCENRGISYTRYCDDMTFSSNDSLNQVFFKVKNMLINMDFCLNENKTHFITNSSRQSVTGITVNEKLSVSKDYKRKTRQEIYYALKFGLENSIINSNNSDFIIENKPQSDLYLEHLIGKANFILGIETDNKWFQNVLKQLKLLKN